MSNVRSGVEWRRARWSACVVVLAATTAGCSSKYDPDYPPGTISDARPAEVFLSADSVSPADDGIGPDGLNDYHFEVQIEGPVVALSLVGMRGPDAWDAAQHAHWDTIVGDAPLAADVSFAGSVGRDTNVLGVRENGVLLNAADGSLPVLSEGPHSLVLEAAGSPLPSPYYRVYAHTAAGRTMNSALIRL